MSSALALAAPPVGKGGASRAGGDDDGREGRHEELGRKARMLAVVGIADALELNEAEALKLSERLRAFDDKRRPVREAMHEAMRSLKAAADGDASALPQVDANVQRVLDGRSQMAAIDKELFAALSQGQSPEKKARLALFLAKFGEEMRRFKGGHGGKGRHHGR
ncbi:MAG: hypothetical protein JNG84_01310 [Archangium sp.]|nr:hypothetical protein [Archangium sp.]